jgi:hypothetical protein
VSKSAKVVLIVASTKRKRKGKALMLGAAGLLAMGGWQPAVDPLTTGDVQRVLLGEEEISDVSLATFHVFDRETAQAGVRLARGGCGHGGGCGCGRGGGCVTRKRPIRNLASA